MKPNTILTGVLIAGTALAAPLTEQRRARHEARRRTGFPKKPNSTEHLEHTYIKQEQYSNNWAGAVLISSGYNSVTGQFIVPVPSMPSGGDPSQQYCATAWVGLDGDTCQSAILQTGVDFCIQSGEVSYSAWYEWFPDYMYTFNDITISAGDTISLTVDASSDVAGTATVQNLSNGQSVSYTWNGDVQGNLCGTNAEWIVEDFQEGSSLIPFANFGAVTFSNAYAGQNGGSVGPAGATIMDIQQNGQVFTSTSISDGEVTVSYV